MGWASYIGTGIIRCVLMQLLGNGSIGGQSKNAVSCFRRTFHRSRAGDKC